jgi:hypothetical protein
MEFEADKRRTIAAMEAAQESGAIFDSHCDLVEAYFRGDLKSQPSG